jgi:hypothetical protein
MFLVGVISPWAVSLANPIALRCSSSNIRRKEKQRCEKDLSAHSTVFRFALPSLGHASKLL